MTLQIQLSDKRPTTGDFILIKDTQEIREVVDDDHDDCPFETYDSEGDTEYFKESEVQLIEIFDDSSEPEESPSIPSGLTPQMEEIFKSMAKMPGAGTGKISSHSPATSPHGSQPHDYSHTGEISTGYFRQRVGSIMRDNMFDREVSGFRSGRLDHHALYKTPISDRVFTKRIESLHKRYNVVLLVDESGSMRDHNRYKYAADMVTSMVDALEHNGVDFGVIGFSNGTRIHKDLGDRIDLSDLHKTIIDTTMNDHLAGYTYECEAIRSAISMLRPVSSQQNISLVFCDGNPSDGSPKNLITELSHISEVFAYGIQTDDVSRYYDHWRRIDDLDTFCEVTFEQLSRMIHRG